VKHIAKRSQHRKMFTASLVCVGWFFVPTSLQSTSNQGFPSVIFVLYNQGFPSVIFMLYNQRIQNIINDFIQNIVCIQIFIYSSHKTQGYKGMKDLMCFTLLCTRFVSSYVSHYKYICIHQKNRMNQHKLDLCQFIIIKKRMTIIYNT